MNGMRLVKIALCFFLLDGAMGAGMLPAGADDTARPASQTADDSRPDNGGPKVKAVTLQGRSRKMIIKKAPTEKEIREREKAIDEYVGTLNASDEKKENIGALLKGKISVEEMMVRDRERAPDEALPIDEEQLRESLRKKGKSDGEIDYFIKTFVRGQPDPEEGRKMSEARIAETDRHLHALWDKMRTALANSDIETAADCIADNRREQYRRAFGRISAENREEMAEDLKDLQLIKFHSARYAEYDVQNTINGKRVSWIVVFIKTPWENEWKIKSF